MTSDPVSFPESVADPVGGLSLAEQQLALLGLCDFEEQWDILEAATRLVVDGEAKAALIRQRLAPLADQLQALVAADVVPYQLWIARRWFATQLCQAETSPEPAKPRPRVRSKTARGARREEERRT